MSQQATNPFDTCRKQLVKIEYDNGNHTITEINGTPDDIVKYYIGTSFVLHEDENTGKETKAVGAKIWFNDGCGAWLQHPRIYKLINKGAWGYVVDHGDKIGLELHSREHNGSKYFTDERREQLLAINNHAGNWLALIKKEF